MTKAATAAGVMRFIDAKRDTAERSRHERSPAGMRCPLADRAHSRVTRAGQSESLPANDAVIASVPGGAKSDAWYVPSPSVIDVARELGFFGW
jgi:hypothetical protein